VVDALELWVDRMKEILANGDLKKFVAAEENLIADEEKLADER